MKFTLTVSGEAGRIKNLVWSQTGAAYQADGLAIESGDVISWKADDHLASDLETLQSVGGVHSEYDAIIWGPYTETSDDDVWLFEASNDKTGESRGVVLHRYHIVSTLLAVGESWRLKVVDHLSRCDTVDEFVGVCNRNELLTFPPISHFVAGGKAEAERECV